MRGCGPADTGRRRLGAGKLRPCLVSREAKPQPVRRCGDSRLIALGAWIGG